MARRRGVFRLRAARERRFRRLLAFHLTKEHGLTPQPRYTHEVMPNPLSFTSVELRPAV